MKPEQKTKDFRVKGLNGKNLKVEHTLEDLCLGTASYQGRVIIFYI